MLNSTESCWMSMINIYDESKKIWPNIAAKIKINSSDQMIMSKKEHVQSNPL